MRKVCCLVLLRLDALLLAASQILCNLQIELAMGSRIS
jgi:hypothetical protein